ncbi:MAG: 4Fe-4S binding protein [bacterium]
MVQDKCIKCDICYDVCKFNAVIKTTGGGNA